MKKEYIIDGLCNCGCGGQTTIYRKKHRKFIAGHQARGECNSRFGIKLDIELKEKISKGNKGKQVGNKNGFYGKRHSDEQKRKWAQERSGIAKTLRHGLSIECLYCENLFYVISSRKDVAKYCSMKCRDKHYSARFLGENNPFYGRKHTKDVIDIVKAASVKQREQNKCILPSTPEKLIHNELNKLGIDFDTEVGINGKFCVDILIPDHALIIYVDGCYWHACPIHCPNSKRPKTDNARMPYLTKCGYNVEIIWEHDIKENVEKVISTICQKYSIKTIS